MTNSWITHVKKFAAEHNVPYACAIANPDCKATYTKKIKLTKKIKITKKEDIDDNTKREIIEKQSFTQIKNKIKEIDGDLTKKINVRMYFNSYNQSIKDKFKEKFPNNYNKLFS